MPPPVPDLIGGRIEDSASHRMLTSSPENDDTKVRQDRCARAPYQCLAYLMHDT
jgi:hypothetical protein